MDWYKEKCLRCGSVFKIRGKRPDVVISCPYCQSWNTEELGKADESYFDDQPGFYFSPNNERKCKEGERK